MAIRSLLAVFSMSVLAGCASMFGSATSDPAVMLQWAEEDISRKNDPAKAEELIREAMEIYEKKLDRTGLAEAHRQYGLFYRSHAVNTASDHYQENGFLDKSVQFKDRYEKAIEHFNKSKDLYASLGRYDALASLHVSLAKTYNLTNRQSEACQAFYKSLESFARYKMASGKLDEHRSEEIARYVDYVDTMMKQTGCPEISIPDISPPSAPPLRSTPTATAPPSAR